MADSKNLFVLLELAAGYALFEVVAFDEIVALQQQQSVNVDRFSRAVKLKAFQPFTSAQEALENINAVSEHALPQTLLNFLQLNLPKSSGNSVSLGVIDPGLATAIRDGLQQHSPKQFKTLSCRSDDVVREMLRGCRMHAARYIQGLSSGDAASSTADSATALEKAQLGLGHSYSRSKVKFNPARSDNMIIQSIALLDQMDKDLNTFAMRIREWYSWHFPELKDVVKDNFMYARCAALIQEKNSTAEKREGLLEIVGDEDTVQAIVDASKSSMGMDCSVIDMVNIVNFTQRMVKLAEYRRDLSKYLTEKMAIVAPNLSALIGDTVAARLISKAGSLTNLAKAPASTVQILGAEKALFRALKTKGNTPKYGLIYHSSFIGRADAKNKGRISRYLANKCSIATRIDSFSTDDDEIRSRRLYGEKLRQQVEDRLAFYETGAAPRKNIDVMKEAAKEMQEISKEKKEESKDVEMKDATAEDTPASKPTSDKKKKKKKKDKKRKAEDDDDDDDADKETPSAKKKKQKTSDDKEATSSKKSKKKDAAEETPKQDDEDEKPPAKKAKKTKEETPKPEEKKKAKEETPKSDKKKTPKSDKKKKKKKSKD